MVTTYRRWRVYYRGRHGFKESIGSPPRRLLYQDRGSAYRSRLQSWGLHEVPYLVYTHGHLCCWPFCRCPSLGEKRKANSCVSAYSTTAIMRIMLAHPPILNDLPTLSPTQVRTSFSTFFISARISYNIGRRWCWDDITHAIWTLRLLAINKLQALATNRQLSTQDLKRN